MVSVLPSGIRVDSFFLADSAQVVGEKLYVLGGGWNYLNLRDPAHQVELFALVGRVLVPMQDGEFEVPLEIHLEHPQHPEIMLGGPRFRLVLRSKVLPTQRGSVETATPFVIEVFGLSFPAPGEYAFVITHQEEEVARTRFEVRFIRAD
ncbi:MAG: hypothetical protein U0075_06705 [Thermomicrobiales bacterium]